MNGLKFTEEVASQLERNYLTKDVVAQRLETIKQLALSEGERVLDIGSGLVFFAKASLTSLVAMALSSALIFRVI